MKKPLIFLLIAFTTLILLISLGYVFFEAKVKKQILPKTKEFIKKQSKLDIDFSSFHFSFAKLLQLQPTLSIKDLKIENAVQAKKVSIELYLKDLLQSRKFVIKEIVVDQALINLIENSKGSIELKGISEEKLNSIGASQQKQKPQNKKETSKPFIDSLELSKLQISNSQINLKLKQIQESISISNAWLSLSDFSINQENQIETKLDFKANLFNKASSSIAVNGSLGPVPQDMKSLPINARQNLTIKLQDLPTSVLQTTFNDMIRVKDNSLIQENASISGDLEKQITGTGKLKLQNLSIGTDDQHKLTADSELPLNFNLRLSAYPNLRLESKSAHLNLKDAESHIGQLDCDTYINLDLNSGNIQGSSTGSLSGLELEEALLTFAQQKKLISGNFTLSDYQIFFKGKDAEQIFNSLKGKVKIKVENGSLYILKSITKYKDLAKKIIRNGDTLTEKLAGEFLDLGADIEILRKNLYVRDLLLNATKDAKVTGSGVLKKYQWLVFNVNLDVPKFKPIPINIRGSLDKPSISPDIKQIGQKQSTEIINGFLQYGLDTLKNAAQKNADSSQEPKPQQSLGNLLNNIIKESLTEPKPQDNPPQPSTP